MKKGVFAFDSFMERAGGVRGATEAFLNVLTAFGVRPYVSNDEPELLERIAIAHLRAALVVCASIAAFRSSPGETPSTVLKAASDRDGRVGNLCRVSAASQAYAAENTDCAFNDLSSEERGPIMIAAAAAFQVIYDTCFAES